MMTESEFIRLSEELFEHIEDQIDENGWATIEVKNRFAVGDSLEIIHPSGNQTIKLEQMTRKGQPVDVAPGNGIQVKIPNMQGKEKALVARIMNP